MIIPIFFKKLKGGVMLNGDDTFQVTKYILTSENRFLVLLDLLGGAKTAREISLNINKSHSNVNRANRQLISYGLVFKINGKYAINLSGQLIALQLLNFLGL